MRVRPLHAMVAMVSAHTQPRVVPDGRRIASPALLRRYVRAFHISRLLSVASRGPGLLSRIARRESGVSLAIEREMWKSVEVSGSLHRG